MYLGGQLKFHVFDTPGVSYLPFIRSSEMVLIEAEANYFLNKEPDAQAALIELTPDVTLNTPARKPVMPYGTKSWIIVNWNCGVKGLLGAITKDGIVQ
mgnify:CR=1 FL=1